MPGIPKGPVFALLLSGILALAPWRLAAAEAEDLTVFDFDAASAAASAKPAAPQAAAIATQAATAVATQAATVVATPMATQAASAVVTQIATPSATPAVTAAATQAAVAAAAPAAITASAGDLNLSLGLTGLTGKTLAGTGDPQSALGGDLSLDYRVGSIASLDVAPGLGIEDAYIHSGSSWVRAFDIGLSLRLALPVSQGLNPYLAGQAGYLPLAGHDQEWGGHYHGAVSLGNRGYFSDAWGLDTAVSYSIYSPRNGGLQAAGLRLALVWRPSGPGAPAASEPVASAAAEAANAPAAAPQAADGAAVTAASPGAAASAVASTASAAPASPSAAAAPEGAIVQVEDQEATAAEEERPKSLALSPAEVQVERAGCLAQADEIPFEGAITGAKSGGQLLIVGDIAYLEMADGHAAVPGQEYLSYRLSDPVLGPISGDDLGSRVTVSGVLKVIRVDEREVLARVTRVYTDVRVGDSFRLRGEKIPHSRPQPLAGDLSGSLAAIRGGLELAAKGEVVYLDLGADQGVQPGMRFIVQRPFSTQEQQDSFESAPIQANGDLGVVEVLSVKRHTCTALVIRSSNALKVGDSIHLR
jgi:hypothetical protein